LKTDDNLERDSISKKTTQIIVAFFTTNNMCEPKETKNSNRCR